MKSLTKKPLFLKPTKAFTLIELMIVIAIIAILATIAIPSYTTYTQKAALSELLRASASYKSDVEVCIYNTGEVTNLFRRFKWCTSKTKASSDETKYLKSVSVASGVITVAGKGNIRWIWRYTMTPTFSSNTISWKTTCTGSDDKFIPLQISASTSSTN